MHREYHRWFSPRIGHDMEMLVLGHAGPRVLVFPTRVGRFFDYENWRLAGTLGHRIEAGDFQLFCLDSIDHQALYCDWNIPGDRIARQRDYEEYILCEVMPFTRQLNPHIEMWSHGCSFGAYHAMALALRHPQWFSRVVAFSGRYDVTLHVGEFRNLLDGHYDDNVYYHCPSHFVPNLSGEHLEAIRGLDIVFTVGREDPFCHHNHEFSEMLWAKGIPHHFHMWDGDAHRARFWRQMLLEYF